MNMTLFGDRVIEDIIKFKWRHTGLGWAPNPMNGFFIEERREIFQQRDREETLAKRQSEMATTQEMPATTRN